MTQSGNSGRKSPPPPNDPRFAQGSCLPSLLSEWGWEARWWWWKDSGGGRSASCCCFEGDLMRRNQRNEWFASFEKAPSGFRFHIYYFQPFQLDPWGFPSLPGGAGLQAPLPLFPSPGTNVCFSHIFITAQAFRKDRGARIDMGTCVCVGSVQLRTELGRLTSCPTQAFTMESQGVGGMLGTIAKPTGSPQF